MENPGPADALEIYLDGLQQLDLERFLALLGDDAVMRFPNMPAGLPNRCEGRSECLKFYGVVPKLFTELRWTERKVYTTDDPEVAIAVVASSGTLPNGKPYDNDYVLVVRVRGGRIVEFREYFDPGRAMAAFQLLAG